MDACDLHPVTFVQVGACTWVSPRDVVSVRWGMRTPVIQLRDGSSVEADFYELARDTERAQQYANITGKLLHRQWISSVECVDLCSTLVEKLVKHLATV